MILNSFLSPGSNTRDTENILLTASNSSATNISTLMIKDQWLTNVCIPLPLPTLNTFLPKSFHSPPF